MTKILLLIASIVFVLFIWTRGGLNSVYLTTDIGRDLSQLSNLWIGHKIIWLGPRLSLGFPTSPIYYYIFYPALWVSQGNAQSLIITNLIISLSALALFGWLAVKKYGIKAPLGLILFGAMPWWINIAMLPGNGFTYVFWLIIALTLLWFEQPIIYASLFLGLSISFNPAASLAFPILAIEWLQKEKSIKKLLFIILALLLPWIPIIVFEVITKGFLTRSFLANPSAGFFKIKPTLINIQNVFHSLGLSLLFGGILSLLIYIISSKRLRVWLLATILSITILGLFQELPGHYLLGITATLGFIIVIGLIESLDKSRLAKIALVLVLINNFVSLPPHIPTTRTISKINSVVNAYLAQENLGKDKKIALVAALGPDAASPQADDYRFFFRIKGYKALDVADYKNADVLIEFIEYPGFYWQNWSTWEIDQFGRKSRGREFDTQGIKVITYTKEAVY